MPKFPNKMIQEAYQRALGHIFTYSPSFQKFTDENQNSDYNYNAMLYLKDQGMLQRMKDDLNQCFSFKYQIKGS